MSSAATMALLACGAAAGLLGALLGVGGGVFLVPALILGFDLPISEAAGASLVAIIATSCAVAPDNINNGAVDLPAAVVLETTTVAGALTGGLSAAWLPARALTGLFSILLAAVGAALWRRRLETEPAEAARAGRRPLRRLPEALGVGFLAGNLSGLLGVGGGVVKVPVLHLRCGMPIKTAAATSNFMIGITGAVGAVVYFADGRLNPLVSGVVASGVLAGSLAGAHLARRLDDAHIRRLFAALTLILSAMMFRRACAG